MGKFSERCRDFSGIYGVSNLPYICEQLMKHGKDKSTPAAIIERELHLCSAQLLGR